MALSDQQTAKAVKGFSNDSFSVGMFLIMVESHVNYPFKNEAELKKAFESYMNPPDPHV